MRSLIRKNAFSMIKEIKITNFYGFQESTVVLQPDTNILIGINGSGKSNFLKAIKFLKEGVSGVGLQKHILENLGGFDNIFFKGYLEGSKSISLEFILDAHQISQNRNGFRFTDDISYKITLIRSLSTQNFYLIEKITNEKGFLYLDFNNGNGKLTEKTEGGLNNKTNLKNYSDFNPRELVLRGISETENDRYFALTTIKKAIMNIVVYDYFDTTPKSLIRKPMLPTSEERLSPDGTNLPQILNTIKINHKQEYRKITESLSEVNPNFSGFDFNLIGGNIELMLDEKNLNSAVHVSNISDGTLRYLCLLTILFNPERGSLICIDEPEVGLHPDMIFNISKAIKYASESSQIIVSTHSENLLNYFEIENVLVFEKDDNNATQINSYTRNQFEGWYDKFAVGQMWQKGDLGGKRYGN